MMNEQFDYRIVQFLGPGEADRPPLQPFEPSPEVEVWKNIIFETALHLSINSEARLIPSA